MKKVIPLAKKDNNYDKLIDSIGILLEKARKEIYSQVNQTLVKTYWEIGKNIVEYEQKGEVRAKYGSNLLEIMSLDLTREHRKGFSRDNLERMRKLYLFFPNSATLSRKLSWSHYCLLFRVENEMARRFYAVEAEQERWSIRELERHINSSLFERVALSKDKRGVFQLTKKGQIIEKAEDLIKNPYVLDFLGLEDSEKYSETEVEMMVSQNVISSFEAADLFHDKKSQREMLL